MFKNGMGPVHPGEILLEDYIKPMGISVRVSVRCLLPCMSRNIMAAANGEACPHQNLLPWPMRVTT